jgi:hypothetical protein
MALVLVIGANQPTSSGDGYLIKFHMPSPQLVSGSSCMTIMQSFELYHISGPPARDLVYFGCRTHRLFELEKSFISKSNQMNFSN